MKVVLYTTGCPNCLRLEDLLKSKNINFEHFMDEDKMIEMGMSKVPMLEVDNEMMDYKTAIKWIEGV